MPLLFCRLWFDKVRNLCHTISAHLIASSLVHILIRPRFNFRSLDQYRVRFKLAYFFTAFITINLNHISLTSTHNLSVARPCIRVYPHNHLLCHSNAHTLHKSVARPQMPCYNCKLTIYNRHRSVARQLVPFWK